MDERDGHKDDSDQAPASIKMYLIIPSKVHVCVDLYEGYVHVLRWLEAFGTSGTRVVGDWEPSGKGARV